MAANEKDATEGKGVASDFDPDSKEVNRAEEMVPGEPQEKPSSDVSRGEYLGDEPTSEPVMPNDSLAAGSATSAGHEMASAPPPVEKDMEAAYGDPYAQRSRAETVPVGDGGIIEEDHEEHAEEHEGSSFAARALLLLIVLILGAGLGIWGASKLAPMLPAGMAPVARWLSPSDAEAEAQLADLAARVDALSAQVSEVPVSPATTADIEAAVSEARASIESDLTSLRTSVEDLGGANTAEQISALQSGLEGQSSELASLKQQLTEANASSEQDAAVDLYQAELEGLRGEVRTLTQRVAALGHRIDEVAATADRSIDAAEAQVAQIQEEARQSMDAASVAADTAIIRAALAAGQPFKEAADRLAAADNVTLPDGLAAAAESGVPTLQVLRDRFSEAAHSAIRASIKAEAGDGFLQRTRAFFKAQLATRSLSPQEGNSANAVLSRMESSLNNGELDAALQEADQLPSEAAEAMSGWLSEARMRLAADAGLAELEAAQPAMN
jgi:hypothetical protein